MQTVSPDADSVRSWAEARAERDSQAASERQARAAHHHHAFTCFLRARCQLSGSSSGWQMRKGPSRSGRAAVASAGRLLGPW
jgi:hypothetical protein